MERKGKGRRQILLGNEEKLKKLCCFMELNILGGTSPHWKSLLVHLLIQRKVLAQLTGSAEALPAEYSEGLFD